MTMRENFDDDTGHTHRLVHIQTRCPFLQKREILNLGETTMSDYELNKYYFTDGIEAMRTLESNFFDVCITDPLWNVDLGSLVDRERFNRHDYDYMKKKKKFDDNIPAYKEFSESWFHEARRVAKQLIFTPGDMNEHFWQDIDEPAEILIHYKHDSISFTHGVRHLQHDYIYCYGKIRPFQFPCSVIDIPACGSGGSQHTRELGIEHASPKNIELWRWLLGCCMRKSGVEHYKVLDPFGGSGTTIEAAMELGADYLVFESDPEYESDILARIEYAEPAAARLRRKMKAY